MLFRASANPYRSEVNPVEGLRSSLDRRAGNGLLLSDEERSGRRGALPAWSAPAAEPVTLKKPAPTCSVENLKALCTLGLLCE